jgi:RimJ/RimL family protein N-acetyltransferase
VRLPYAFPSPLHTERLRLRTMTLADIDDVHAFQSREDVCRYLTFGPRSYADVAEKVAQFATATTLRGDGDYWQLALEHQGHVIGDLYFSIKNVQNATAEIGWGMHPDHHGHGYMTEAATAVLNVAFGELGLHRVMAEVDPRNTASAALCTRLGMREEARLVEAVWFKGEWSDTGIYAILEREWARRASESRR